MFDWLKLHEVGEILWIEPSRRVWRLEATTLERSAFIDRSIEYSERETGKNSNSPAPAFLCEVSADIGSVGIMMGYFDFGTEYHMITGIFLSSLLLRSSQKPSPGFRPNILECHDVGSESCLDILRMIF